mmetsp:Transcript_32680/g.76514  ORF Transcript_32680/g.76514 Transcript_32680/m.76514 type:complete len:218 (+) Transcript_32680:693-1346(+)
MCAAVDALELCERRAPRLRRDCQCARQPVPVVAAQGGRPLRVIGREQREGRVPIAAAAQRRQPRLGRRHELGVGLGRSWRARDEPVHVHGRAAHADRRAPACLDLGDRDRGVAVKVAGRVGLVGLAQVEQVVGHARQLGGGRLVGADVERAVDLHRVDRDDLAAQPQRELHRHLRLAHAGRPRDEDHRAEWWRGGQLHHRTERAAARDGGHHRRREQ